MPPPNAPHALIPWFRDESETTIYVMEHWQRVRVRDDRLLAASTSIATWGCTYECTPSRWHFPPTRGGSIFGSDNMAHVACTHRKVAPPTRAKYLSVSAGGAGRAFAFQSVANHTLTAAREGDPRESRLVAPQSNRGLWLRHSELEQCGTHCLLMVRSRMVFSSTRAT